MFEWFVVGMLILLFITQVSIHSRLNVMEDVFREFIRSLDHVSQEIKEAEEKGMGYD